MHKRLFVLLSVLLTTVYGASQEEGTQVFKALKEKPYIQVDYPQPRAEIEAAVQAFFHFLELPDEIKDHIHLKISDKHRRGDVGLVHRTPMDGYSDSKDFFHYHPMIWEEYERFIWQHKEVKDFLLQADMIWNQTRDVALKVFNQLEPQFPGLVDSIFNTENPHLIIRFLKYNWAQSGECLAKGHFDAGSFTLAIAESCPGLRIGTTPEDLELIQHQEGKAVFMVASNFQKLMNTNEVKPGWHDVVQQDATKIGQPFARWAVVAFMDGHSVEALSQTETHKWNPPASDMR